MPATSHKQRILNQLFFALPKNTDIKAEHPSKGDSRPVLEQFIYAICREGTTKAFADRIFRGLQERFFDWNEIRVSSAREVAEVLGDLPFAEPRAQKIIDFLQEVFELNYSFDLEGLHKKGLKVAAKQLARYQAADDYNISWVVQRSLGGHSIPLDEPTRRVIRRLALVESSLGSDDSIRSSLEHQIPKAKGPLFTDLISHLADEFCSEDPQCRRCPLSSECSKNFSAELHTQATAATA